MLIRYTLALYLLACASKPTGEPTCEPMVRWGDGKALPLVLDGEPPAQLHVAERDGCSADNGRLTATLADGERSVGRFAVGTIECGPPGTVQWLNGQAPAEYPLAKQGFEVVPECVDCTCRDVARFYPGRPPYSVRTCRPGSEELSSDLHTPRNVKRIVVKPGIYRGDVTLQPGVELVSEYTGAAVIIGSVTCADDAALEGFVITGGTPGIYCASQRVRITRNVIRGNFDAGLVCDNCSADVGFNTFVGNFNAAVRGAPALHDNVMLRHDGPDVGEVADLQRDDFRRPDWPSEWISDAAQEYIVEGFFNGVEMSSGLVTGDILVPPAALTYHAPGINAEAIALFLDAAKQTSSTQLTAASGDACTLFTILESAAETRGDAYPTGMCAADARTGGVIAGGRMLLASDVLDNLHDEAARTLVMHESGHLFGLRHVFRALSPIAYGPQRLDYGGVDKEALAVRACTPELTFAEWRAKGYVRDHVLEPFPAIERIQMIGGRLHIFGSRFTLRFGSHDMTYVQPIVYFDAIAVSVDTTLTQSWHGGVTRNLEVDVPEGFTEGWVSVEARGLRSIPVRFKR